MVKNRTMLLILMAGVLVSAVWPASAYAFTIFHISGNITVPAYSPTQDVYILYFDPDEVVRIVYGSYEDSTFSQVITQKTEALGPGERFVGLHRFTCNTYYQAEYFNAAGQRVGFIQFQATEIVEPTCSSGADNIGTDNGGSNCGCIFNTPGWQQYLAKIDQILGAIPPPPNWNQVADTFYERVVPRMIADLRQMLGTAPNPPSPPAQPNIPVMTAPPQPEPLDDRGIGDRQPSFTEPEGLREATFTLEELERTAPVIEERQDPIGGFSILNPIDSLPELPDSWPIPGQTDAGEWDHQPAQPDIPYPDPPEDQPTAPSNPPLPGDAGGEPPLPGELGGQAPIPGGGGPPQTEPKYKTHPDNPDGV